MNKIPKPILLFLCVFAIVQIGAWIGASILTEREWALVGSAVAHVGIFLCVFAFARTDKISLRELGFRKVANWKKLMLVGGLVGFVAQLTILIIVAVVSTVYFFEYFGIQISVPLHIFILGALISGPVAAIVEEAAFRGYIQKTLTAKQGFVRALVISSVLFAVCHISLYSVYLVSTHVGLEGTLIAFLAYAMLTVFPLGIFLGYAYQKTGQNLICPVSLHAVNNVFALFLVSYSTYTYSASTLGYGGFILINLVRIGVTAIVLVVLLRKIAKVDISLGSYRRFFSDVFTPETETTSCIKTAPVIRTSSTNSKVNQSKRTEK